MKYQEEDINQKSKKMHWKILNCFTNEKKLLLNHLFYFDYSSIVSKGKYKSIHGGGIKILTPKQMLQSLPLVLAQVKAGNTSENLLNEIR